MQERGILNVQLPEDRRVVMKENEKVDKCQEPVKEAQFEHREHRSNYCTDRTLPKPFKNCALGIPEEQRILY